MILKRYSDFDWASNYATKKLIWGYIFMLNRKLVSWYLKYQSIVVFFSTEAKYIVLTLASKKITWLWLLLIELGLLLPNNQYTEIKIMEESRNTKEIKINLRSQKEEDNKGIASKATLIYLFISVKAILFKGDNQRLIALIHNPVYYAWIKPLISNTITFMTK